MCILDMEGDGSWKIILLNINVLHRFGFKGPRLVSYDASISQQRLPF